MDRTPKPARTDTELPAYLMDALSGPVLSSRGRLLQVFSKDAGVVLRILNSKQ